MLTIVCLIEAVSLAAVVAAFASLLRSERRATARERDLLVNQLLHAAGKPWQPAPANTPDAARDLWEIPDWSATPEQLPVY